MICVILGIVWFDITEENTAKLLKTNRTNIFYNDIDGNTKELNPTVKATGLER